MTSPARKTAARKSVAAPLKKTSNATAPRKTAPPTPSKLGRQASPQAKLDKAEKTEKVKKPKVVRDSFTFPKDEYAGLERLKQRALKLAHPIKKGELLRAGIKALDAMPDAAFLQALRVVPSLKTGRPKKS